jgi:GNAT superfamily N-acetyltransferase
VIPNSPIESEADKEKQKREIEDVKRVQDQMARHQRTVIGSSRANVAQATDLDFLFMLASISVYHDLAFMWIHGKALVTFSYTPDGVSLDRLWVPVRYRNTGSGRQALLKFVGFFAKQAIPVYLTVAPLDKITDPETLVGFYRSCGFRPTGYINAIKLPEMIHGDPVKRKKPKQKQNHAKPLAA